MSLINTLITNISNQNLSRFFENKITSFKPEKDVFVNTVNEEDPFSDPVKIGHAELKNHEELLVFTCESNNELTARSAKKEQFEIAKKVLKEDFKDGAIFIFYDTQGNFRFSFIRRNYGETGDKKYSAWKRYTYYVTRSETNRTFKDRIDNCVFDSLDNIQEAFSVEKLTKQFYNELFAWYQWALSDEIGITYPNNTNTSDDDRIKLEEQVIRLITRLLFVWFIKQKKLVPEYLFKIDELTKTLKDFDGNSSEQANYYNAILQNLFFATLNQEISDREFAKTKNRDIKTRYRYEEMFNLSESEILELFKPIPFLNGGLFECLDKQDANGDQYFLDGFSRNPTKSANGNFRHRAFLPNCLFFDKEKGIIPLLKRYNFTVEENAPNEVQVALDPELLGKVFENLLGAFNPETKETARKQSGSFYTPREIVDYMVDESLINYLTNKLPNAGEDTLRELFEKEHLPETLVNNINLRNDVAQHLKAIKILDPACGSGAFPMGILNKMVEVLEKLHANSESIHDLKLHLIEECIYGIDIQPIAIQISKLRFFISLVVEQEAIDIHKPEENYGVLTLPNLETKFVAANTLIGISKKKEGEFHNTLFTDTAIDDTKQELLAIRHEHFYAKTAGAKKRLRELDAELRDKLADLLRENKEFAPEDALQLSQWNPYDQNASSPFFDMEWMFGLKKGFDVVIGNPPYINIKNQPKETREILKTNFKYSGGSDIYVAFLEIALEKFISNNNTLTYIIPNKFFGAIYGKRIRKYLKDEVSIKEIYNLVDEKVFESAAITTVVLIVNKQKNQNAGCYVKTKDEKYYLERLFDENNRIQIEQSNLSYAIIQKLNKNLRLKDYGDVRTGIMGFDYWSMEPIIINDSIHPNSLKLYTNGNIKPFVDAWDEKAITLYKSKYYKPRMILDENLLNKSTIDFFKTSPKLIIRGVAKKITSFIDYDGSALLVAVHGFKPKEVNVKLFDILLNSNLLNWYHLQTYYSQRIPQGSLKYPINFLESIPIVHDGAISQILIEYHSILSDKLSSGSSIIEEMDVINILIYKLYNLTHDEVLIIDPEFSLTQEEYDNYNIES